jgi:A/G-specific adenine glycosylase
VPVATRHRSGMLDVMTPRPPLDPGALNAALLAWYDREGRRLAFRNAADPYAVLVSEVMLQQTQVGRVEAAWPRFLARFPTVQALAAAPSADVLRAWAGMGYNRRALNLRRAAAAIVGDHLGRVPSDVESLQRLPGVGPYTARAVAAVSFGVPTAAIDTNVRRFLGRVIAGHGAEADPGRAMPAGELQRAGDALVDRARPAEWTHAAMDLGAKLCRPRGPRCGACPLARWCAYATVRAHGAPGDLASRSSPSGRGLGAMRSPFESSSRWLRGRLIERLRATPNGAWHRFDGPIGSHDAAAVANALAALQRDGLLELDREGRARLPS